MAEETRIQTYQPQELALDSIREMEDRFAIAVRQRELLADYITHRLQPGKHFYKVADGQKPSLTKEGGELICLPHGLKPMYFQEGGPKEPADDDVPYQITVKCRLMKGDSFEGEGLGSASSHITKKTGGRAVRMRDIGLRHNATLKMAQKSAYIAATLNATAASEFFTQDMEDGADATLTPPGASSPQQEGGNWCPEHQAAWFKRGKMKNYAHPIGDTGEWCNKPAEAKAQPTAAESQPQPAPPPQADISATEFWAKAKEILGENYITAATARLGMTLAIWVREGHTYREALERIEAAQATEKEAKREDGIAAGRDIHHAGDIAG